MTVVLQGRDHGNYCGPGRPAVYRREVRERALAIVREGVPKKDVARRLGVSYSTVKDWCRREGVKGAEAEPDMLHEFPAWVKCRDKPNTEHMQLIHVMECSACGGTYEHINGSYEFCPRCGRKVVDA